MSILADFFVDDVENAGSYEDRSDTFDDRRRVRAKNVTSLELSMLWVILQGREWDDVDLDAFGEVQFADDGSRSVHRFPDDFVASLAELDDAATRSAAERWIDIEEFGDLWDVTAGVEVISDIRRLAMMATESGQGVFIWNCL